MRGHLPGDAEPIPATVSSEAQSVKSDIKVSDPGKGLLTAFRERKMDCPICGRNFISDSIKGGTLIAEDFDLDLRPRFKNADITLYKVIQCPHCGYSNHEKFFNEISSGEVGLIKSRMIEGMEGKINRFADRTYENTYPMYRSALSFSMIGGINVSKRAYIALYCAWLIRGWREDMEKAGETVKNSFVMGLDTERKLMKFALNNFKVARGTELFPICGMEMAVFDYLLAALFYLNGEPEDARRYLDNAKKAGDCPANVQKKMNELTPLIRKKLE